MTMNQQTRRPAATAQEREARTNDVAKQERSTHQSAKTRILTRLAVSGGLIAGGTLLCIAAPSASAADSCGRVITDRVSGQAVLSGDDTTNITITKAGSSPDNSGFIFIKGNGLNGIVITDVTYTATGPVTKTLSDGLFELYTNNDGTGSEYITSVDITACDTTAPAPSPTAAPTPTATPATTATPTPSGTATPTPAATTAALTTAPVNTTAGAARATIAPGGTETVSAGGFIPGEKISAVLHSTPVDLGTYPTDAGGVATVAFIVPTTLETGAHSVVLTGLTSGHVATAHFTVTAAPAELASTGVTHTGALLSTGAVAAALGVGLVLLAIRRRQLPHATKQ